MARGRSTSSCVIWHSSLPRDRNDLKATLTQRVTNGAKRALARAAGRFARSVSPQRSGQGRLDFPPLGVGASASAIEAWESLRSEYEAAKSSRFRQQLTGVAAGGSGADFHYRSEADYLKLMELGRHFDRNDMIVGQGLSRLIHNVLQDGIRLNPQTGDKDVDAELSRRWRIWSEDSDLCHDTGELNLHDQAKLVLRAVLVDGDSIVLPQSDGTLQIVETHRLRSPRGGQQQNVVLGVKLDDRRTPIEYWLTRDDISPTKPVTLADIQRFPTRDADGNRLVFHVLNRKRVTQTRGISVTASIADAVAMLGHIQFAHLVQAQICSAFAIIHTFEESEAVLGKSGQKGERTTETRADGSFKILEKISPGLEIFGRPGEAISGFSPNVPNPEFFPHATMILGFIAINLNLPIHALLLDATKTNFSGWRGAMDQAKYGFRDIQRWMINRFYRPTFRFKLAQWLAEDEDLRTRASVLTATGDDIFAHDWQAPSWAYIEPSKDVEADRKRLAEGLTSHRRLYAERSMDWDDVLVEIVADRAAIAELAIQTARRINAASPEADLGWRELAPVFDTRQRRLPNRDPNTKGTSQTRRAVPAANTMEGGTNAVEGDGAREHPLDVLTARSERLEGA